jgi:surface polysaccharide O-acyltransferase-like enzyme
MDRSISADLIKAFSIFGVVFIHGSFLLCANSDFQQYTSDFFRFCVPCFIIIWAYFFEKSYQKKKSNERKKYILSKFIHLFTIFFIWSSLYFLILVNWNTINLTKLLTTHFSGCGWAGQYFFIILFQLLLLFPLIRKLYIYKYIYYPLIIIIVFIYIYYGFFYNTIPDFIKKLGGRPFVFWIPYVFIGISIANQKIKKIRIINAFILLLIPLESFILNYFEYDHDAYITPGVLVASILFTVAILLNPIKIKSEQIGNIITLIGKNTMTIFVANPLIIMILSSIIPKNIFPNLIIWQIFLPFLSSFIILCICMFISVLINKTKMNGILN